MAYLCHASAFCTNTAPSNCHKLQILENTKIFPKNLSSNFHWLRIDIRNVSRHSNTLRSRKDRLLMYTRKFTASKLFAVVLAAAMLLTMTVSAFASEIQPYYDTEIVMSGSVDVSNQVYTVSVLGPTDITNSTQLYTKSSSLDAKKSALCQPVQTVTNVLVAKALQLHPAKLT